MRVLFVLALGCFLFLSSCADRVTGTADLIDPTAQHPYFPLETGRFIEYQVDSVVFDFAPGGGSLRDSSTTFVREMVGDTITDNNGEVLYRIERYERADAFAPWTFKRVETAARTTTQAIRTENNLRFLKLIFPLDRRTEWNGNLWIDADREIEVAGERIRPYSNWLYEVDSIDQVNVIGPFVFDSVLTVSEVQDVNAIEYRFSRAKYAKGVGLVWREQWILDSQYCNTDPTPIDCLSRPWLDKAERGYIIRQLITNFQ
ncbi:MAG: hypothetical protein ACOYNO_12005 [Saprospiraceae bacterium]